MLLYFIVRVEVIEIQIWFQFKLVWNLENIFEKDKVFSIFPSLLGRNRLGPAGLSSRARPDRPNPRSEAKSNPLSESNLIAPNQTR
jgi:hypothetical protein